MIWLRRHNKAIVFIIMFATIIFFSIYWAFFSMARLPKGEFLLESKSPNNNYTIKAYLVNGGATTSYAIRAELIRNNRNPKNIYWNYREENAVIKWLSDDVIEINGHILSLPNDKYDFRRKK